MGMTFVLVRTQDDFNDRWSLHHIWATYPASPVIIVGDLSGIATDADRAHHTLSSANSVEEALANAGATAILRSNEVVHLAERDYGYADTDLTFHMRVTKNDLPLAHRLIAQLRAHFPACGILIISDGDHGVSAEDFPNNVNNVRFIQGDCLYGLDKGDALIKRMLFHFLESPTRYLFKVDPDTQCHRRFAFLPRSGIWGTVQTNPLGVASIQGGFIGFDLKTCETLFESSVDCTDYRATWSSWAKCPASLERAEGRGMISEDWVLAYLADSLSIPMRDFPEVCSRWKVPDPNYADFSFSHPHKEPTGIICTGQD